MKLRVRKDVDVGYDLDGNERAPGEVISGEHSMVPASHQRWLEPVPGGAGWREDLKAQLGREPTKDDLIAHARSLGLDTTGTKDEIAASIDEAEA